MNKIWQFLYGLFLGSLLIITVVLNCGCKTIPEKHTNGNEIMWFDEEDKDFYKCVINELLSKNRTLSKQEIFRIHVKCQDESIRNSRNKQPVTGTYHNWKRK